MDMYGFWRSQATFRLRVALNLKGIAYREIPIDLDARAQNADDFRKVNPMGSVPALVLGRPEGLRGATRGRVRDRHALPRRHADLRRRLPRRSVRRRAGLLDRGRRHPHRASYRRDVHGY